MKKRGSKAVYWFITGFVVVLLVPIIPVFADYQTFMHPWRAELTGSVLLILLLAAAFEDTDFRNFLAEMPGNEIRLILIPCIVFIAWSGLSALWARSPAFALYHTSVWISYVAFYALFRYYARSEEAVERWITALMIFLWIIGVPALVNFYANVGSGNPSNLGLLFSKYTELANTVLPLIVVYAVRSDGTRSLFGYATVILIWLFDNASLSRTGIGMFVIGGTVLLLLTFIIPSLRTYRLKTAALAGALLVVTAISSAALIASTGSVPVVERAAGHLAADSSNMRRLFLNIALEMSRENSLLGVGANNYGIEFSRYRQNYVQRDSDDPFLELAEDVMAERAHNEYAQMLAELGGVGLAIFAVFLLGIVACASYLWRARDDISPNTVAALVGLGAFLASSLVTSYSFRIFQNGLVFFFVLSIAVGGTLGQRAKLADVPSSERRQLSITIAFAVALISSVFLTGYCLIRVAALYKMHAAVGSKTALEKNRHFEMAIKLDPNNAVIYRAAGLTRLNDRDPVGAAAFLRQAIDHGMASSVEYSFLATAQLVGMNSQAASQTIDEALTQFPRSVFLHVRSGVLLKMLGRAQESDQQFQIANDLDPGQVATWRMFLESGALKASQTAAYSNSIPLIQLRPRNAVAAVQKEREMLFPDEKF